MKYFLIILLGVIPFFAPAQDVTIPSETARYFLEQDDRAKILAKKDSANRLILKDINLQIQVKQGIIDNYKNDSITFRNKLSNKDQEISLVKDELNLTRKIVNTQKFEVNLFAGTATGAIIGSVVPAIGTFGGGIIGAATGCVIYGIQKIRKIFKHKII